MNRFNFRLPSRSEKISRKFFTFVSVTYKRYDFVQIRYFWHKYVLLLLVMSYTRYFRLWIDTHDEKIAEKAQLLAKQAGVPVRYVQIAMI